MSNKKVISSDQALNYLRKVVGLKDIRVEFWMEVDEGGKLVASSQSYIEGFETFYPTDKNDPAYGSEELVAALWEHPQLVSKLNEGEIQLKSKTFNLCDFDSYTTTEVVYQGCIYTFTEDSSAFQEVAPTVAASLLKRIMDVDEIELEFFMDSPYGKGVQKANVINGWRAKDPEKLLEHYNIFALSKAMHKHPKFLEALELGAVTRQEEEFYADESPSGHGIYKTLIRFKF